jgi:predicted AAA+ superfamily ATPase
MRLPIGYDDFGAVIDHQLKFVDKSLFIKDIIDDSAQVILITRPRRFGKTFNLSLLHYFFSDHVFG